MKILRRLSYDHLTAEPDLIEKISIVGYYKKLIFLSYEWLNYQNFFDYKNIHGESSTCIYTRI